MLKNKKIKNTHPQLSLAFHLHLHLHFPLLSLPFRRDVEHQEDPIQRGIILDLMTNPGHTQTTGSHPRQVGGIADFQQATFERKGRPLVQGVPLSVGLDPGWEHALWQGRSCREMH